MAEIFRSLFDTVRRNLPRKLELFMADILVALIDECQNLPQDVLEVLMAQFMDKKGVSFPLDIILTVYSTVRITD